MKAVCTLAADILREAASKKWFLALGIAASALLAMVALALRIDLADGAFAAIRIFGSVEQAVVQRFVPKLFEGATYLIYFGGTLFGILACSDFAPSLLAPGRVEHLLSLPIRRWELLLGTWLGVLCLALSFLLYVSGGLVWILGMKSGVWSLRPLLGAALGAVAFSAIYATMLATTLFIRSAAVSAAAGFSVFVAGMLASQRDELLRHLEPGALTNVFAWLTALLPPFASLGLHAGSIAGGGVVELGALLGVCAKTLLFGFGAFALSIWRFEGMDP